MKAIDLFAGAGGFSEGARMAGVAVAWAANHWPLAVQVHAQNHPQAQHVCQDLHQADWSKVPSADLVLASPSCQGHSTARGKDRPHHDAARATAWAVVSCTEQHRPRAVIVENVAEFLKWELFPAWKLAMEALGYRLSHEVLDAADFGVPQHRERVFLVAAKKVVRLVNPRLPHVAAESCIDWESGNWSLVQKPGRATKTLARWRAGSARFGRRFLMPYYGSGSGLTGRELGRPIGTITTRDRWALVDGSRMRMLTPQEYRALMGFPETYSLPPNRTDAIHLLGNAVPPPMAAAVVRQVVAALA